MKAASPPPASPTGAVIWGGSKETPLAWILGIREILPQSWKLWTAGSIAAADLPRLDCDDEPLAILAAIAAGGGLERVCLIRAGSQLPRWGVERLTRCLEAFPQAAAISPLSNDPAELAPLPAGERLDKPELDALDRLAFLYSYRACHPAPWICPTVSLWRLDALVGLPGDVGFPALGQWLRNRSRGPRVCDHVYVHDPRLELRGPRPPRDPRDRPAPTFLEALRSQVARAYRPGLATLPAVGLDQRPVMLHILHSWGGGASQWVRDISASLDDRHHLILVASGNPGSRQHGQELRLYADQNDPPLRHWPMPDPIASTSSEDGFYRQVVDSIIEDFSVTAVAISSLIGHSLDALRTGLPTLVVWHDYYPSWPLLRVCFESPGAAFSLQNLERELAGSPDQRFTDKRPEDWFKLRDEQLKALSQKQVRCVVPSASVAANLRRLDGRFAELEFTRIPHGSRPFPSHDFVYRPPHPGERLRLLVPGRLNAGKGKGLLQALLPKLGADADVYLLGAGKDAEDFFGLRDVHIVIDYQRDSLPGLLAAIKPHLVLLLSTVSETFGYTLSEMRDLGIPVMATAVGAFCERLKDGEDGWLVAPEADAIAERLRQLAAQPEQIAAVAKAGPAEDLGIAEMAERYRAVFPLPEQPPLRYPIAGPSLSAMQLAAAARSEYENEGAREQLERAQRRMQRELERRAEWAQSLSDRLEKRTRWSLSLRDDLDQALENFTKLQSEFEQRTQWAKHLNQEVSLRDQRILSMEQQIDDLNVLADRLQQVIHSRSWRLTRPLRFAARQARTLGSRFGFQSRRAATLAQRTHHSLRVRGVSGTVGRIRQEFRRDSAHTTPVAVPELNATPRPLTIPRAKEPRVSIVIPAYNHYPHTYACLRSVAAARVDAGFEVIVVDDASDDESADQLALHQGLRVLRNDNNLGFLKTCNRGASAARGAYLVFLNNDTAVGDGWLDRLLETFEQRPDAGLVGAKLVYPDGRLQEAGGIVFADGSGWNYGRFADPDDPAYNFVREVDYCSGACIMIGTAQFSELGGFEPDYAPAYYEDTDLAFKVRAAGRKVYYQPAAAVTHFEGVSSGTDITSGIKRYQAINQKKFQTRWAEQLAAQPQPGTPIELARRHRRPRSALIIDACTPTPDQDSGSLRMVNLMQLLMELGFHLRFLADNRVYVEGYTPALQQLGVETLYQPHVSLPQAYLGEHGKDIDLVIVSRHYVARHYLEMIRKYCPRARLIFDTVDLHYLRERRLAELEGDPALAETARRTRARELDVARRCDLTLVVSPLEKRVLADEAPELSVRVLSNIHRVHGCRRGFAERHDLLFVGGFQHPPNVDAVRYFVAEILPLVRRQIPEIKFLIVGSRATPEVRRLASEAVQFLGYVADLEPYLDGCRLALAPLRYGAGVKGKINMSMSYGQPVVATSPAIEGMYAEPGVEVLIGDTPQSFADEVIRAYRDQELWERLSQAALANVERYFSFAAARRALLEILEIPKR